MNRTFASLALLTTLVILPATTSIVPAPPPYPRAAPRAPSTAPRRATVPAAPATAPRPAAEAAASPAASPPALLKQRAGAPPAPEVEAYRFESRAGDTVDAQLGTVFVPERRGAPNARHLALRYVRFPSTAERPGSPIVYLAGGPGGSGIGAAQGDRFPLFMALREIADVIAFDQRATGVSEPDLSCPGDFEYPLDQAGDRAAWLARATAAARRCLTSLRDAGVDLLGYTTRESAEDLEDLRRALGAEKITLWGISYGTHLGLAFLRQHPESVDRAILAGVEGPDHTFMLPQVQEDHLRFLDALARKHPVGEEVPELHRLVADVMARLERDPVTATVDGEPPATVKLGRFDAQLRTAMMFHSRNWDVPRVYYEMSRGDFGFLASFMRDYRRYQGVGGLGLLVECASGASPERLRRIRAQRDETLLGAARSFPYPDICETVYELVPGLDLGAGFREPVESDVPTLFISGSLDGVTPVSNALEVAHGFSAGRHLIIQGGAHDDDLFLSSPLIVEHMLAFLRGQPAEATVIAVPFDFALPGGG